MNIRKLIKEEIEAYLKSRGLNYFIGGSERFNWTRVNSDIDFFINTNNTEVAIMLDYFPLAVRSHKNSGSYENCGDLQYSVLGGLVHLNFFVNSSIIFDHLRLEHMKIEEILKRNPELNQVVKSLKVANIVSGKNIYRALKLLVTVPS